MCLGWYVADKLGMIPLSKYTDETFMKFHLIYKEQLTLWKWEVQFVVSWSNRCCTDVGLILMKEKDFIWQK